MRHLHDILRGHILGSRCMIVFRNRDFYLRHQFQTNSVTTNPSIQSVRGPFHLD
jgi:hypothetical protein